IADHTQAITINPNYYQAYSNRGVVYDDLGRYEEAIADYDKALSIKPDNWQAWGNRGWAIFSSRGYQAAMENWDEGLTKLKPDHPEYQLGCGTLHYLKGNVYFYQAKREEHNWRIFCHKAINSYLQALAILEDNPKLRETYLEVLQDLVIAYRSVGDEEKAKQTWDTAIVILEQWLLEIPDRLNKDRLSRKFDRLYQLEVDRFAQSTSPKEKIQALVLAEARKNLCLTWMQPTPESPQYQEILQLLTNTTTNCHSERSEESQTSSCYEENDTITNTQDDTTTNCHSERSEESQTSSCDEENSTNTNTQDDTVTNFDSEHQQEIPEILRFAQDDTNNVAQDDTNNLAHDTTTTNCHSERSEESQTSSCDEENSTNTNTQDDTVTNFDSEHQQEIPEILRFAQDDTNNVAQDDTNNLAHDTTTTNCHSERSEESPKRAIIYFHLSPVTITTFILKPNAELKTFSTPITIFGDSPDFETWIKDWKQDYENSRKKTATSDTWKNDLDSRLNQLAQILNLAAIQAEITHSRELILIPHRDLHLLPLHYFFQDTHNTITYLPSAKIGLSLAAKPVTPLTANAKLLSIEPKTNEGLLLAELEAAVVTHFYQKNTHLDANADENNVIAAMQQPAAILHFTGHAEHNLAAANNSALALANQTQLTQRQIFELDLPAYELVCLSACETGLTGKSELISEFVGLASTFLAKQTSFVLSTLWTVNEISTALIIIEFYRELRTGKTPQVALKQAQNWLRRVIHRDLAKWYRELAADVAATNEDCQEDLETDAAIIEGDPAKMESNLPPYRSAYFWAGFVLTGKVL
ncbi:MAG: CHAT domain-containing protein, partial [Oscillatoria sp. PMC 1051.18]|nr:CHAT domain-containing protein [Oscillatoria sp. PMC 1051.18]